VGGELLLEIPQKVRLGAAVERQARLVEQQDDVLLLAFDVLVPGEEREEPDEPTRARAEWRRRPVDAVVDLAPDVDSIAHVHGVFGQAFAHVEAHLDVLVL
jgi:hypothetical protein